MAEIKTTLVFDTDTRSFRQVENKASKLGESSAKKASDSFSDNFSTGTQAGLGKAFVALKGVAIAAGAALGAAFAGREIIQAAIAQEDAVNSLNASLRRIGEFSNETSADLQNFAAGLQQTSRVVDEVILQQLAIAQSFGATADQSKALTAAALDLASAQGKTLEEAVRQISKTLGGYAGELGETIPELKNLTQEQLRNGEAVDLIAGKYRGFAEREAQTFSGSLAQLTNNFGDVLEQLGFFITQSDAVQNLFKGISDLAAEAAKSLKDFRLSLQEINEQNVDEKLISVNRQIKEVQDQLKNAAPVDNFVTRLGTIDKTLIPLEGLNQKLKDLREEQQKLQAFKDGLPGTTKKDTNNIKENTNALKLNNEQLSSRIKNIGVGQTDQLRNRLNEEFALLQEANERQLITEEELQLRLQEIRRQFAQSTQQEQQDALLSAQLGFDGFFANISKGFLSAGNDLKKFNTSVRQLGASVRSTLASGFANAFNQLGQALVSGQNAFDAFSVAILGTFGQLATQIGTFFILQGAGFLLTNPALGTGLIAAGAALSLFGGVLGGIASSNTSVNASNSTTDGVQGGGVIQDTSGLASSTVEERQDPGKSVVVNIQGDVMDSRESGLRIVELINEATENDGAIVTGIA